MKKLIILLLLCLFMKANLNYPNTVRIIEIKPIAKDTNFYLIINFDKYTDYIKKHEAPNYEAENTLGFLGAYQFGSLSLYELGFVRLKPDSIKNKAWLSDKRNWTGKFNIWSKNDFKRNKLCQDVAFMDLTQRNYLKLRNRGIIATQYNWEGMLAACHLAGINSTINYLTSKTEFHDFYGTSISKYINLQ